MNRSPCSMKMKGSEVCKVNTVLIDSSCVWVYEWSLPQKRLEEKKQANAIEKMLLNNTYF